MRYKILICFLILNSCGSNFYNEYCPDSFLSSDASIDKELPNSNFSESNKLVISQNGNKNSLLQINIKSIVKNTQLDSAFLYLYVYKEFKILEDDFLEIEPITENWKAEDVNWNTKPETDSTRKIQVKLKRNNLNCYRINVTNFVEEITSGNQKNMGLLFKLNATNEDAQLTFLSSEIAQEDIRPRLIVYYTDSFF